MLKREEPQYLLNKIVQAVRSNKPLDLVFKDHRKQYWLLSLKRLEK